MAKDLSMLKKIIVLFLGLLFSSVVFADAISDIYQSDMIKKSILNFMRVNRVPGVAVDIIVNGQARSYYFGYADLASRQQVSGNTLFEIGSVTKLFTSLLLAEDVKSGRIELDKPVTNYLPDFAATLPAFRYITFGQLATHTSGLPFDVPASIHSRQQLVQHLRWWRFPSQKGHYWIYSNVGMGVLGDSLETLNGQDFNTQYCQHILLPLGMEPVGLDVPPRLQSVYAQGYQGNGAPARRVNLAAREAAGSMKASANDMFHFLRAAIGLPGTPAFILSSIRLTQTPFMQLPAFQQGLGWQMYQLTPRKIYELMHPPALMHVGPIPAQPIYFFGRHFDGNDLIDKTGTTAGFRAYIAVIPNKQTGIVILVNKRVSDAPLLSTARSILFKLNGLA